MMRKFRMRKLTMRELAPDPVRLTRNRDAQLAVPGRAVSSGEVPGSRLSLSDLPSGTNNRLPCRLGLAEIVFTASHLDETATPSWTKQPR